MKLKIKSDWNTDNQRQSSGNAECLQPALQYTPHRLGQNEWSWRKVKSPKPKFKNNDRNRNPLCCGEKWIHIHIREIQQEKKGIFENIMARVF